MAKRLVKRVTKGKSTAYFYIEDNITGDVVGLKVEQDDGGKVEIKIDGFGDYGSKNGHGTPIYLDLNNGVMKLHIWADINREDPTHVIDLTGARETKREPPKTVTDISEVEILRVFVDDRGFCVEITFKDQYADKLHKMTIWNCGQNGFGAAKYANSSPEAKKDLIWFINQQLANGD